MKKFISFTILTVFALLFYACDNSSNPQDSYDTPPASNVIDWNEKPQSCTIQANNDTIGFVVTLKNWSWNQTGIYNENKTHITNTFTGLEESVFDFICNQTKKSLDSQKNNNKLKVTNFSCTENSIIIDEIIDATTAASLTTETLVNNIRLICKDILNMTVKEGFFSDEDNE